MKRLVLLLIPAAAIVAACNDALPKGLDQAGGNAPLIVDLDGGANALVVTTATGGAESVVSVRGPNKGTGEVGGITGTFTVTSSGTVCAIMDPANKHTNSDPTTPTTDSEDDGDSDLYVGLAANYTGTPGTKIGDFTAEYVDPLGVTHIADENLCIMINFSGLPGHAGAADAEFCDIDANAGTQYVLLARTISVPVKGEVLKVAMQVRQGPCGAYGEDTLTGDN